MMEFIVKEVTIFRVATFFNKVLGQTYFLTNLRNIQTVKIWTLKSDFNKEQ